MRKLWSKFYFIIQGMEDFKAERRSSDEAIAHLDALRNNETLNKLMGRLQTPRKKPVAPGVEINIHFIV